MHVKLVGFGIFSLFLIMLLPVYAEVTEISIENNFYTVDQGITFLGMENEGSKMINVLMINPNGKESYFVGAMSNSEGVFKTVPKKVDDFFSIIGTYQFVAFTIQKDSGAVISLEFDGNKIFQQTKSILQLNPIQNKIVEVERTITFTVSITDDSFVNTYDGRDPVYTLENAPVDAVIDEITGKFIWTPSKSYGSFEDVIYNFDIIVKADNQEDRENISIIVKKAYDEPVIEPTVIEPTVIEPLQIPASFIDQTKDPQTYVDRYSNEPTYKEWFDENYPQYSSIYEAVGLEEPEFGMCGEGTKLINGVCTIIQKTIQKSWWQFW